MVTLFVCSTAMKKDIYYIYATKVLRICLFIMH